MRILSNRSAGFAPAMSEAAVIAPALIMGLRGRSVSGSRLISLNGSPEGSTSIFSATASTPRSASASAYVKGFEMDWMVNGTDVSPTW